MDRIPKIMYRYWDGLNLAHWAMNPTEYRKIVGRRGNDTRCFRVAHIAIEPPPGYKKIGRGLANDPIILEDNQ